MIIDFHTHIFPDALAKRVMPHLTAEFNEPPSTDGTADGLLKSMSESRIDLSIVLPVVTKPQQFHSITQFALQINERFEHARGPRLLSFAGIHPDSEDYMGELNTIKELGFKGIKLHPDDQNVMIDDIRYKRIIARASELDLIISIHAGYDPTSPCPIHAAPRPIARMLDDVRPQKVVLAHMGSNLFYDEVERTLVGRDVYLDTSFSIRHIDPGQMLRIIRNHGHKKILFGSDVPWTDQKKDLKTFMELELTPMEREDILFRNARQLLHL